MELSLRDVKKSFGDVQALKGISLTARSGSPLGLLGRNGAGKTTAMRIVMNVFTADSGEILLDGKPIPASGARLGYLPEERGLYRKMTVSEQLVYFARLRGLSRPDAQKAVSYWLERLEMGEYRDKKLDSLSKGNQQRIQLALALINDPDVVILDEPFSGLDPVNAMQLRGVVSDIARRGKIIIFSSHQMAAVEDFCNDICIMNRGDIVLSGKLDEIRSGYPHNRIRIAGGDGIIPIAEKYGAAQVCRGDTLVTLSDESSRSELLLELCQGGRDITAFEVVEPTLEEIFVSVAGSEPAANDNTTAGGAA